MGRNLTKQLKEHKLFFDVPKCYDDVFYGNRNDVNFEIAEINSIVFKGVYIFLDLNKFVKNNIVISNKMFLLPQKCRNVCYLMSKSYPYFFVLMLLCFLLGKFIPTFVLGVFILSILIFFVIIHIVSIFSNQIVFNDLKKIELEDVEFNEKYMLYSDDEVEARYLATPAFMERLKNLELAFCAKKIKVSCRGSKMLFAIESRKDLFEFVDIKQPLNKPEQFKKFFDQISSVLLIIDHFKLDEKTGL